MGETAVHFLLVGSAVSAAFFGVYAGLNTVGVIFQRAFLLRTPLWKRWLRGRREETALPQDAADLVPWEAWRVVAGLAGTLALAAILWGSEYAPLAIFGSAAAFTPSFVRRQMKENARWRLRLEVREFVAELRLALALNITVSQALEHLAQRAASREATPFMERVRHHVQRTLRMKGPEAMFEALAEEFNSEDLRRLLALMRAAQRGGMSLADALAQSADSIAQNIIASAELSVEETPTRLILPMLFALFPTIFVLALLPALSALVTSLSGLPTQP